MRWENATVPPGADADYWCKGAGSASASGRLDACSWDFRPVVPDPANPASGSSTMSVSRFILSP